MSNISLISVGSNERKKDWVETLVQLQGHGCFVFCAYLFVENYTPGKKKKKGFQFYMYIDY